MVFLLAFPYKTKKGVPSKKTLEGWLGFVGLVRLADC